MRYVGDEGRAGVRRWALAGEHTGPSERAGVSPSAETRGRRNQILPLVPEKPEIQILCDGPNF